MSVEFMRPLLLLLLPAYVLLVYLIDRRSRRVRAGLKRRVTLGMRFLLTCLCVLALASPTLILSGGQSNVWILTDASDSARTLQEQMTQDIQTALNGKNAELQVGVIAFGGDAMVETPLSGQTEYHGVRTAVNAQESRLSDALTLAGALLPSDGAGRIVVLSDGQTDDTQAAAKMLAGRGISVDVLTYTGETLPDAQVTQVNLPSTAYAGQAFSVTVQVDANTEGAGTLVLYQNRQVAATRDVTIRKGENTFVFRDTAVASGVVTYEAQLLMAGDMRAQNDRMGGYVHVLGAPQLLVVEGRVGEGSEMSKMLSAAGMAHEVVSPAMLPTSAEGLRAYDAVVLVNVDHDTATSAQWQALADAVRVLGRGLCVIGGDQSYALGGYRGTELEEMLPVTIDVRSKLDMPSLALMLVIDKSGSMTDGMFGTTRLELAKEAAMRAAEVLASNDQVGVIAFDDAAKWVVPLQGVTDVAAIQEMIGTIRPGGGTAFYTPLYEAKRALNNAKAAQKHIIFLTDGASADSGYLGLVEEMLLDGITLTTVAVGSGADVDLMERLAKIGGGRAYAADEFTNLPKIFTKETYLVSGSYVQNRAFTPVIVNDSVLTDFDGFPMLTGYLAATEKALATVELCSDREDPLLCWWQYGAGRVLSFMADSRGAWTKEMLAWKDAAAFYGGMVAHVLPMQTRMGEIKATREGDTIGITFTTPEGAAGQAARMTALLPDGMQTEISLAETAPGVYSGAFESPQQGAFALRCEHLDENGNVLGVTEGGLVKGYSREYDLRRQTADNALPALAAQTGGRVLSDAKDMLTKTSGKAYMRVELVNGLLWALVAALVVDIALRRLSWDVWLEKYVKTQAEDTEKPQKQKAPAVHKPKKTAGSGANEATAQQLLERQKNKKLM